MRKSGIALLRSLSILLGILGMLGLTLTASARPVKLSPSWPLAFVRSGDIWLANGDGSGQHLIIKQGEAPAWSPDRKQLAFARQGDIWVANADGSDLRRLTVRWQANTPTPFTNLRDIAISWEPRERIITLSHWESFNLSRVGPGKGNTFVACGLYAVPLHPPAEKGVETFLDPYDAITGFRFLAQYNPAWSSSGKWLAFTRNGDIWTAQRGDLLEAPDSPQVQQRLSSWGWTFTRFAACAYYDGATGRASRENEGVTGLSWSPDEKTLAYSIGRLGGSGFEQVRLVEVGRGKYDNLAGKNDWLLVEDANQPCFSPDGRFIAYVSTAPGQSGIWAVTRDGKARSRLVYNADQPAW